MIYTIYSIGLKGLLYSTALLRRWDVNIWETELPLESTRNAWSIMNRCFCKTKCISSKSCTDQKGPPSFICSFNMFYLQCDMIFSALTDTRSQGFMISASTKHHLGVGPLFLPTLYPCNCRLLLKDLKAMSGQQVRITSNHNGRAHAQKCAFAAWGPYTHNHQM